MNKLNFLSKLTFNSIIGIISILGITSSASAFVITDTKWGNTPYGTAQKVTWSLVPNNTSCNALAFACTTTGLENIMPFGFKNQIQQAFQAWSNVSNISFEEISDDGLPIRDPLTNSGHIRLGGYDIKAVNGLDALAVAYAPPRINQPLDTLAGDIFFDISKDWKINSLDDGNPNTVDIFQVAAHEIGHAIGLDHTDVPNSLMNAFYSETFIGLQPDDIDGARYIYGSSQPINQVCGLPRRLGTLHFNLLPNNGCTILQPGQTLKQNFDDTLNAPNNLWRWATMFTNPTNSFQSFVVQLGFTGNQSPLSYRMNLEPNEIVATTAAFDDRFTELRSWEWSGTNSSLNPIAIDTLITEANGIVIGGTLLASPTDPEIEIIDPDAEDSFSVSFYCSSGDICFEETTDNPDIIVSFTSVPEPSSIIAFLTIGGLGLGLKYKKQV